MLFSNSSTDFHYWEKTKDITDQLIDMMLNYRQSGHPGGSRSKVHLFLTLCLSGAMRWDIRNPGNPFADRFVLSGGHTVPLIYASLAVFNEAMKARYEATGDSRYLPRRLDQRLLIKDLLGFRRRGGLSGHAEMADKTLFLKFNTGPSGHGFPAAAGEALALKKAGLHTVKVFSLDGEGGLTPGSTHEVLNSAWGLGLNNLYALVDWNDFGIDDHPISDVLPGTPADWFGSHAWHVYGTEKGSDWESLNTTFAKMFSAKHTDLAPSAFWFKTRKGRGYGKYDAPSHGTPFSINSPEYWKTKEEFAKKYKILFENFNGAAPVNEKEIKNEFAENFERVLAVLQSDESLVNYLSDRLLTLAEAVPDLSGEMTFDRENGLFKDEVLFDYKNYPSDLYEKPGKKIANRNGLAKWGSWINAYGAAHYSQPVFIATAADLSGSTNISGFGDRYQDFPGFGWYERNTNKNGVLLPQEITEFTNAGIMAGMASVNFSDDPESQFNGFWGICSTYASFSYLKYGLFRLYSQLAQDCNWKVGKIIWVAGHSGPETADDSRTHFGIFAPGVTMLFPEGSIINLHPWEHNEVPVLLGEALKTDVPIVALHLTRPAIEIPDREALGMPSHFSAAKGAYIIRDSDPSRPRGGTFIVQGTSAVKNVVALLGDESLKEMNVKLVCATSPELFSRLEEKEQAAILDAEDKINSTVITTQAKSLMQNWFFNPWAEEYAIASDWDNRWRSGGKLDEVLDEAHLTPEWILKGMRDFVASKESRLDSLRKTLDNIE